MPDPQPAFGRFTEPVWEAPPRDNYECRLVYLMSFARRRLNPDYSFVGPQASTGDGEIGPTRQTFAVYFCPEELPVNGPIAKLNREQAESLFQVSTSRPMVGQRVIDKQTSHFCDGNYMDGNWKQTDPNCHENVQYMNQSAPSTYWAVAVDLRHQVTNATH